MCTGQLHINVLSLAILVVSVACNRNHVQGDNTTSTQAGLQFQNPVFNKDFPDPNLVIGKDGYFYAYSTQATWRVDTGTASYIIPILKSKNLVTWNFVGAALSRKPEWKSEGGIWAPDATYYNGRYFLYYSFSTWGDPNPGIGIATASSPEGPFEDHGKLFLSKEIGVPNSIDAFFFEDRDKPFLVWGSFHGIYGIELTKDGLALNGDKFQIAGKAYEGSLIIKKDDYYYFFGSVGSCCEGARSTYRVKVGRSHDFKGPYLDKEGKSLLDDGGTLILEKNPGEEGFIGPGHNGDIITDDAGQSWMLYHAFDKKDPGKRVMLLDKISWVNGWPVIEGAQPTYTIQNGPIFK